MANTISDQKNFKPAKKFSCGDVGCAINEHQPYFIDITLNADCLTVKEARALRDWLNKVLP